MLMSGAGMFLGNQLAGYAGDRYPRRSCWQPAKAADRWKTGPYPHGIGRSGDNEPTREKCSLPQVLGLEREDNVSLSEMKHTRLPATLTIGTLAYDKPLLLAAARKADRNGDGTLTREEWRAARRHDWATIWLWPAGLAAAVCLLFLLGTRTTNGQRQAPDDHSAPSDSLQE